MAQCETRERPARREGRADQKQPGESIGRAFPHEHHRGREEISEARCAACGRRGRGVHLAAREFAPGYRRRRCRAGSPAAGPSGCPGLTSKRGSCGRLDPGGLARRRGRAATGLPLSSLEEVDTAEKRNRRRSHETYALDLLDVVYRFIVERRL